MSDNQCCGKSQKKAWNNPWAPRARCGKKAAPGKEFCAIHQKRVDEDEAREVGSSKWRRSEFAPKAKP